MLPPSPSSEQTTNVPNRQLSGTATTTHTDNSMQTFTLRFEDWCTNAISSLPNRSSVAVTMPYRNGTGGTGLTPTNYMFYMSTTLQAG
ncbi:hypothetical protein KSZ_23690 [Dictyobacter formicarum]|uniref:Uncharacterized protein n=2 Tax=Dictyobacter formicarum TaxID=2778368 RepID=A0ABQ3VG72_9CHLR|nr:hypothetical protein KSZ_23690 [Dictyobacter formicarum]